MTLKSIFTLIILSLFITSCTTNQLSQNDTSDTEKTLVSLKKEPKREVISDILLSDINHILFLLKQNDLDELNNRFIYKQYGLYEISKNNEDNKMILNKKLQIDEISDAIDSFEIKQEDVIFNCSPYDDSNYGWNKEGVFISANIKPYLSDIMKQENLLNINTYSQEEINKANFIEKTSYEIVIPYNVVFYITKINNQWYITLIDKIKTDCSE
jgi:hypothetical protein